MKPVDLEAVNQRFRIALESARMLVFEWDIGSDSITLDGQGLGPDRLLFREDLSSSQAVARLVHPDELAALHRVTVEALKDNDDGSTLHQTEARFADGAGNWVWVHIVARIVERDASGHAQRMIGTLSDISARKRAQRQIEHLRDAYSALSATSQAIVRSVNEDQLFAEICRIAVQWGGFRMAWIGLEDEDRMLRPVAAHGEPLEYLEQVKVSSDPSKPEGRGPGGLAMTSAKPSVWNRFLEAEDAAPWLAAARSAGFQSLASFPIFRGGRTCGVIGLYSSEADYFDQAYVDLIKEMTSDISFAIDNFEHDRERRRMERALAQSEAQQRAITDAALDSIISLDSAGNIIRFNPAAEHAFGLLARHVIGKSFVEVLVPARSGREVLGKLEAVQREPGRASRRSRVHLLRHDGSEFRAEIAVTSTALAGGTVSTLHVRDISDLERHEQLCSKTRSATGN